MVVDAIHNHTPSTMQFSRHTPSTHNQATHPHTHTQNPTNSYPATPTEQRHSKWYCHPKTASSIKDQPCYMIWCDECMFISCILFCHTTLSKWCQTMYLLVRQILSSWWIDMIKACIWVQLDGNGCLFVEYCMDIIKECKLITSNLDIWHVYVFCHGE